MCMYVSRTLNVYVSVCRMLLVGMCSKGSETDDNILYFVLFPLTGGSSDGGRDAAARRGDRAYV